MKKQILFLVLCFFSLGAIAQIEIAEEIIVKDSMRLDGVWISGVKPDSSLYSGNDNLIPTIEAVRIFVKKEVGAVGGNVTSVFGRTGAITAQSGDYTASQVTATAHGDISATTTQGQLEELETEKLSNSSGAVGQSNIAAGAVGSSELQSTAVSAGDYGSSTNIPVITIDEDGRVTSASNIASAAGTDDQTAAEVPFTPAGDIAATDVQAMGEELDSEKVGWADTVSTPGLATKFDVANAGSGISGLTTNYMTKATSGDAIGDSQIYDGGVGSNVGLGTATPSYKFDVVGSIRATANVFSSSASAAVPSFSFSDDIDCGMFRSSANRIGFSTAGVERVHISDSGRVGIGTSSPTSPLEVSGDLNASLFEITGAGGFVGNIRMTNTPTTGMAFGYGDSQTMILTSGQNVLFGTNSESGQGALFSLQRSGAINYGNFPELRGKLFKIREHTITDNVTAASGTTATFAASGIASATLEATNASVTTTNATNFYIAGLTAGTNMTITNNFALWLGAGLRVDGPISLNGSVGTAGQYMISGGPGVVPTWGTLTAFNNGGNSFGGTATLGTDDNHPLAFETVNIERMRLGTNGVADFTSATGASVSADVAVFDGDLPATSGVYKRLAIQGSNSNIAAFGALYEGVAGDYAAGLWSTDAGSMNANPGLKVMADNTIELPAYGSGNVRSEGGVISVVKDTQYVEILAVKRGTAVSQSAGADLDENVFSVGKAYSGYSIQNADYNLLGSTATSGSLTVGLRKVGNTNTLGVSNQMSSTFTGSAVRASSTSSVPLSENEYYFVEVSGTPGDLDVAPTGLTVVLTLVED